MNKLNIFDQLMIWLAGHDIATAKHCTSSEIHKIKLKGSAALVPPILAFFSWGYAFHFFFENIYYAFATGIIAFSILLAFERTILGLGKNGKFSFGLVVRVLMALTAGMLVAEPVLLFVFDDSITEQLQTELLAKQLTAAKPYNDKISEEIQKLDQSRERLFKLRDAYNKELDGLGSLLGRGPGKIYKIKLKDYQDYQKTYSADSLKADNEIKALISSRNNAVQNVTDSQAQNLTGRINALNKMTTPGSAIFWASWLLRIFLVLIEVFPTSIKISHNDDRDLYRRIIDAQDLERENNIHAYTAQFEKELLQQFILESEKNIALRAVKAYENQFDMIETETLRKMNSLFDLTAKKSSIHQKLLAQITNESLLSDVELKLNEVFNDYLKALSQTKLRFNDNNLF